MATAHLKGVTYWYPNTAQPALRDVDLTVGDGITLVTGPSGGGKSTLLRVLNGLVPHFHGGRIAGAAEVAGLDLVKTSTSTVARTVGFVFQDPELQAVYESVEREVAFGLENTGVSPSTMPERVDDALREAGAQHLAGRRIRTLSGGERQRVAIASVIAMQPRLVVLDEPTSQLDDEGAALVLSAVGRLTKSGRAVVIAEHRLGEIEGFAGQAVIVDGGLVQVSAAGLAGTLVGPGPARAAAPGREAWALTRVSAGFRGCLVLDQVDLAGRAGEVLALSGPNGGGKTTLLRTIAGVLPPLGGAVDRRPGRIAYLPQNPTALLHRPTVRSEVELTLSRSGAQEPPEAILEALGLSGVADRYPRDLSSGERQRAALAAILAGHPDIVLLDEPTRGMDARARADLVRLVARLRDDGSAVVLSTHDAHLRRLLADREVRVGGGTVTELQLALT